MAKKVIEEKVELFDSLGAEIISALNSKYKSQTAKAAYFLSDPENTADVTDWVSTGSTILDLAISNRPHGGFPVGRIIEIIGESASGKSLLAAHALASTQKKGGIAVYIDTESAVSTEFLRAIGINVEKLIYIPHETIEECFETIETIITKVKAKNNNKCVTIVLDSIMGASTKIEQESDYDKDGWSTAKAIILSKAMRKITNMISRENVCLIMTNQLRTRLGISFGQTWTTAGGKAVGFHSSVRIMLKDLGKLEGTINGVKNVIGKKTQATIIKSRMGPPLRSVTYNIYFQSGIDDSDSWLEALKELGLVKQSGAWYSYDYINEETGEIKNIKFQSKDFATMVEGDMDLKHHIYAAICEKYILKYDSNDIGIDDIEITEIGNYENAD